MRSILTILGVLLWFGVNAQTTPVQVPYRSGATGQVQRVQQDKYLRAVKNLWIPFTNSVTPTTNNVIDSAYGSFQGLSNGRLATSKGLGSGFWQYYSTEETTTLLSAKQNSLTGTGLLYLTSGTPSVVFGTAAQYIRGNGTLNDFSTSVRAAILSTFSATNLVIDNTDNVISGFNKAQGQINVILVNKANLASPTFTGVPLVPTAATGTNTTQASSVAFVQQEILADRIVNTTTTALTTSDLNTAYPSVKVGFRVICHLITGAPAIYTKATEAGSSDVWLTTSVTVTP